MNMADDLDPLENLVFDPATGTGPTGGPDPEAAAAEQSEAAAVAAMEQGLQRLLVFALKAVRAGVARKLPEIHNEWPDAVLHAPAEAAVPLLRKHMARLMEIAGSNPELAMLAVSLVPLGMGYVAAVEKHARTVSDVTPKPDPEAGPDHG